MHIFRSQFPVLTRSYIQTFTTVTSRPASKASRAVTSQLIRNMATNSSVPEWLVIAPDFDGALEKRLSVRQKHLGGLKEDPEGFWLFGGAMLEEQVKEGETPKMKGSAMLIGANTREEVVERLKRDPYVEGKVWDWEKVQIIPFKSALRKPM